MNYYYQKDNQKIGPLTIEELKTKNISENTLVWFKGLEKWTPLKKLSELRDILNQKEETKYFILDKKEKKGPYSIEYFQNNSLLPGTLIWKKNLEHWTKAKDIEELQVYIMPTVPAEEKINDVNEDKIINVEDVESIGNEVKIDDNTQANNNFDINSSKNESNPSAGSSEVNKESKGWKTTGILFIIISVVLGLVSISQNTQKEEWKRKYDSETNEMDRLHSENNSLESENKRLELEINNLNKEINLQKDTIDFSEKMIKSIGRSPIIITKIDFSNVKKNGDLLTPYGKKLYANQMNYLKTRIKYNSQLPESSFFSFNKRTLFLKIYDEKGQLEVNSDISPSGYTTSYEITVEEGFKRGVTRALVGWGNESGGYYNPGIYRVEIWHKGNCIGYETVELH
jgi:cell division protein FtsB